MASSIGPAASCTATVRPVLVRETSPASESTSRCFITAGSDIEKGCANSLTEASRSASCARIARRVGSESAAKVRSRWGCMVAMVSNLDRHPVREFGHADRLILDALGLFHCAIPAPAGQDQYLTRWLSNIDWPLSQEPTRERRNRPELRFTGSAAHLTALEAAPRNPAEPKDSDDESP
jgi:hypothetical protein